MYGLQSSMPRSNPKKQVRNTPPPSVPGDRSHLLPRGRRSGPLLSIGDAWHSVGQPPDAVLTAAVKPRQPVQQPHYSGAWGTRARGLPTLLLGPQCLPLPTSTLCSLRKPLQAENQNHFQPRQASTAPGFYSPSAPADASATSRPSSVHGPGLLRRCGGPLAHAMAQSQAQAHAAQQPPAHYADDSRPPPPTAGSSNSNNPNRHASSSSVASSAAQQQAAAQHKRVYQACIPCRRRKVRCDLGSVDNPHDPPCVRCRRESKECYFSATRRKRKTEDGDGDGAGETHEDEYIIRNGRKRLHTDASPPPPQLDRRFYSDVPLTPGGSVGRTQPLRRPGIDDHTRSDSRSSISAARGRGTTEFGGDEPNTPLENYEARTVMRKEVYGPHDALDLLYKAAHDTSSQALGLQTPALNLPRSNDGMSYGAAQHQGASVDAPIDPQLTKSGARLEPPPAHADALKAWTRFRFVRAGWFTAQEAIDYID